MTNFTNVSGVDTSVYDKVGHGTTVASLAAGKAVGNWPRRRGPGRQHRFLADHRRRGPDDDGSGQGNEVRPGQGYGDFFRAVNLQIADAASQARAIGTIINNSWGGLYWSNEQVTNEFVNAYSDLILNRDGLVASMATVAPTNATATTRPITRPYPANRPRRRSWSAAGSRWPH